MKSESLLEASKSRRAQSPGTLACSDHELRSSGRGLASALVLALILILSSFAPVAIAVGGGSDSLTKPWVARVIIKNKNVNGICTGEVVGPHQVLTAAHCVEGKALSNVTVTVGSNKSTGGTTLPVHAIAIHPNYLGKIPSDGGPVAIYDLAVLYVDGSFPAETLPLPLAPTNLYSAGRGTTVYGWGGGKSTLQQGNFSLYPVAPSCSGTWMCYLGVAGTRVEQGDSGGPWITVERGDTLLMGSVTGYRKVNGSRVDYGPDFRNGSMRQWIINAGNILVVSSGNIIRNATTGESWRVGADGFRARIPTGGDYLCFVNGGASVVNTDAFGAAQTPLDHNATAICSSTPPPVGQISLSNGGAAPSGYWYSVALSGFAPGSTVTVTCHDSVDPQGFWTQTFTINSAGQASDTTLCYSADGPDHWVTGAGVESNHVSWSGGSPPPPPPPAQINLTKGAAAPSGYWYSVVLTGFAPGSSVTVTCRDSVDPQGFWNQTFTINGSGQASDSTLCYSGDHPDHWVTGGGVESNHVTW